MPTELEIKRMQKLKKSDSYRDVKFRGTVRIFGTADAWIDEYDDNALLGEDFDAFQVRMTIMQKLDMDLCGGEDENRPWYRPFDVETREDK